MSTKTRNWRRRCARWREVSGRPVDILTAKYPFYVPMTVPGGLYAGNPRDVRTFGVTATVVSSSAVDADAVYAFTRAVFENLEALRRAMDEIYRERLG